MQLYYASPLYILPGVRVLLSAAAWRQRGFFPFYKRLGEYSTHNFHLEPRMLNKTLEFKTLELGLSPRSKY